MTAAAVAVNVDDAEAPPPPPFSIWEGCREAEAEEMGREQLDQE